MTVRLQSIEGTAFEVAFEGARLLPRDNPEGMIVYALSEVRSESSAKRFEFTNSNEGSNQSLVIEASKFTVNERP